MTHAQTIDKLAALRECYRSSMYLARLAHERLENESARATEDDRLAAASRPTAWPEPIGVHWPSRVPS